MKTIYYDDRWIGSHGIGRFAKEISPYLVDNLKLKNIISNSPSAPLDSIKLSYFFLNKKGVYFSPGFNSGPILNKSITNLITIHDLMHIHFYKDPIKTLHYKYLLNFNLSQTPYIFTVSHFSKNQICNYFNLDEKRVVVLGNSVSNVFKREIGFKQTEKYFFIPTNQKKHKNNDIVLDAFSNFKFKNDFSLVFLGLPNELLTKKAISLKINSIKYTGIIDDEELYQYYLNAHATIFPSLYEGFGIPLLESMSTETPLICSNATSIPEIARDAALYFTPSSHEELTEQLNLIVSDSNIGNSLSKKGKEILKQFEWKQIASLVNSKIEEII